MYTYIECRKLKKGGERERILTYAPWKSKMKADYVPRSPFLLYYFYLPFSFKVRVEVGKGSFCPGNSYLPIRTECYSHGGVTKCTLFSVPPDRTKTYIFLYKFFFSRHFYLSLSLPESWNIREEEAGEAETIRDLYLCLSSLEAYNILHTALHTIPIFTWIFAEIAQFLFMIVKTIPIWTWGFWWEAHSS